MMDTLWSYLSSDAHRTVVGWCLAGLIAAISGIWQVYKFSKEDKKGKSSLNTGVISKNIENTSIAIDNSNSNVNNRKKV